jgi:ribonuclease HII
MTGRFDPALLPPVPDFLFEAALWGAGIERIAGIDEAGRGALAGPVAVAALILPDEPNLSESLSGVLDSKELTAAERERWSVLLRRIAVAWGVGFASHAEIDDIGIVPAVHLAARRALERLSPAPEHLLIDYLLVPDHPTPQTALIKGDARSLSIAGASILAKTARDALLCELDAEYPGYGFAEHKGYCTPGHLDALARLGACPVHRRSYAPVREISFFLTGSVIGEEDP